RDGVERLGPARAAGDILQAAPDVHIVLIRTRGLWGSRFTYARTGSAPNLMGELKASALLLLSNLFLFMPRRRIEITVEVVDRHKLPELRRETLNPWLERWYNAEGPETPTFVPYHFLFGPRTYQFPEPPRASSVSDVQITPATKEGVRHILEDKLHG